MMFYLDIESDASNMQTPVQIAKALTGVALDLQRRGDNKSKFNGKISDSDGNVVGEYDFRPTEEEELPFDRRTWIADGPAFEDRQKWLEEGKEELPFQLPTQTSELFDEVQALMDRKDYSIDREDY